MAGHPFWNIDCPVRGVALKHMHDRLCVVHEVDQCCYCLVQASKSGLSPSTVEPEPTIDVAARLRAMGLVKEDGSPVADYPPQGEDHAPFSLVEPKYITGEGPTGPKYGPGRGEVTPRFQKRLIAVVGYRAWLAAHGGGEGE